MIQIGILNMCLGFLIISLSAAAGSFVAVETTYHFIEKTLGSDWALLINASSHGHTSLFGLIHIVFGLTIPYSRLNDVIKKLQTTGLIAGCLAMGPGMMIKATQVPQNAGIDVLSILMGIFLSLWLGSVFSHAFSLALRLKNTRIL